MRIFTTGGCGFIGSNLVLNWIKEKRGPVVNIDSLNYAGQLANLKDIENNPLYTFIHGNINNRALVANTLALHAPECIIHFATESNTNNRSQQSEHFLVNNVLGTFNLLEETLKYWQGLPQDCKKAFRFIHISTNEVYGNANHSSNAEYLTYQPQTPYAASKACADHFVSAYGNTYGLPTIIIHLGNIYGPRQYREKLIPTILHQALTGQQLKVYGNGQNMSNWLYVNDAVAAIALVIEHGISGEVYHIDGGKERSNLSLIKTMCKILEKKIPHPGINSFESLIHLTKDGIKNEHHHDSRNQKIQSELGWHPNTTLNKGLEATINWYIEHLEATSI